MPRSIPTLQPQIVERSYRISRLEKLYEYILSAPGVEFERMETVAEKWREAH